MDSPTAEAVEMSEAKIIPETDIWYQILFDKNPLPMFIYDRQSLSILGVNQSAIDQYGYARSEWLKMTINNLHRSSDIQAVADELTSMPEAQFHRAGVWRHLRKDRTEIFVDILHYMILFQGEKAALAVVQDVTEKHRTEQALREAQCELNKAQEIARLGSWVLDSSTHEIRWSDQEYRNFGLEPQSLIPSLDAFLARVHPDDRKMVEDRLNQSMSTYAPFECDLRVVWPDGTIHVMRAQGGTLFNEDGQRRGIIGTALDITEYRIIENQLRQTQQDLDKAQEIAHIGNWVWDVVNDKYQSTSAEWTRILGFSLEDMPVSHDLMFERIHPDDRELVRSARALALATPDTRYDVEYRITLPDGSKKTVHSMAEVVFDLDGKPLRMIGILQDITKQRCAEEKIRYLAYYDEVTGLPNRVWLRTVLDKAFASRHVPHPIALLIVDIVRLRDINYTFGHANGDQLLKECGVRIRQVVAPSDTVARIGNVHFAVVLGDASAYDATSKIRQILAALEAPTPISGTTYELDSRIGIALAPGHGTDTDTLLRKADVALYQAKQSGQAYAIYQASQDPYKPQRLTLMGEFRKAIHNGELQLYCQPKADIRTRRIVGAEALVRWQHRQLGMISPSIFVPLIEQTDMIHLLTKFMLQASLHQYYDWHQQGIDIPLAVNLSVRNLMEPDLAANLDYLLQAWGADAQWLGLEITESSLMTDPVTSIAALDRLSKMGFRLFIDDFGTGYSSLGYLMKLPVNVIKIDSGFTMHMVKDKGAEAIVKSTIELAHNLGMNVVAEGTASQEIWNALLSLGCDEAQGHFISPPMSAPDFLGWLRTSGYAYPDGTTTHAH
jgi:diguanylate cyclase (GGDEF)-like protein/PAS domain S-box-containing protein